MENKLDVANLKDGMKIEYIGDSFAFGGEYNLHAAESTYADASLVPEHEKGKLMIIELMNDGTPMYFTVDSLDLKEWRVVN